MSRLSNMRPHLLGVALMALASSSFADKPSHYDSPTEYAAPKALHSPVIDGIVDAGLFGALILTELEENES